MVKEKIRQFGSEDFRRTVSQLSFVNARKFKGEWRWDIELKKIDDAEVQKKLAGFPEDDVQHWKNLLRQQLLSAYKKNLLPTRLRFRQNLQQTHLMPSSRRLPASSMTILQSIRSSATSSTGIRVKMDHFCSPCLIIMTRIERYNCTCHSAH